MKLRWLHPLTLTIIFCLLTGLPAAAQQAGPLPQAAQAAAPASDPGDSFNWWLVHADAPLTFKDMSPHSMGVASDGTIHVVYGGDHLYHVWKSLGVWYVETVDPAWGVGSLAALAIDSLGKLHVSYIDTAANRLKYATNRYGSWQVETPSIADGLSASNAAIAVDSVNDPHIVFSSYDGTLRYGYFDSEYGDWVGPETLATGTGQLNYPGAFALAVTLTGVATPHVSFHKHVSASNGTLYYTTRGSSSWTTPLALALGGDSNGDTNDIALNGSIPHIAASAISSGLYVVRYTFLDGASWHPAEPVATADAAPTAISLRLVGSTPYIAYQDPGYGYNWLSRNGDNDWTDPEAVVLGASTGSWASFAWYNGYPYATYYDPSTRLFSFRTKNSTGWQAPYTLATNGHEVGAEPSLAVDTLGRSHIVYGDFTSMQLLYARYDGSSWARLTVDPGPVFSTSSLALENNLPKVLYFGTDGTVRYTSLPCARNCAFTSPEIVDSGLTTPMYRPALAISATTGVQAAYYKNGKLIYAQRTGPGVWSKITIDSSGTDMIYDGVAMALDASGAPSLLYHKGSNLVYAYEDSIWHTGNIIATGTFGEVSFKISPQGVKAAAYADLSGSSPEVVFTALACIGTSCFWLPHTVDSTGDDFVDLAFDSQGGAHLAYFGEFAADLKYAERTGGAWTAKVIDSRGVLAYPSIAVSPLNGRMRIAYDDFTNKDLKLALEGQPGFLPIIKK